MPESYDEKVASLSLASAGFSRQGGRATLPLLIEAADLTDAIKRILGTVEAKGDGSLRRTTPICHPQYGWMLANAIESIRGIGSPTKTPAVAATEGTLLDFYALYPTYEFTIGFNHEPWAAQPDSAIEVRDLFWYDDDGDSVLTQYATEYLRYVAVDFLPSFEIVTATYGFSKFRNTAGLPNNHTFPGAPRLYIGKSALKFTWHQVPFTYLLDPNSPIVKFLGRVNQRAFYGVPAGGLLYSAVGVKRYVPPVPNSTLIDPDSVAFHHEYHCDLEFFFEMTDRAHAGTFTPSNLNWIAGGHNLLPWFGGKDGGSSGFYYVTATDNTKDDTDQSKWHPQYKSFLFEHLFTDPEILEL